MPLAPVTNLNELGENRALVMADLHLHPYAACARPGPGGLNTRLLWGINVVDQIRQVAQLTNCKYVINAGDTLDVGKTYIPAQVADAGFKALARLHAGAGTDYVLVGNHEQPAMDHERTALRPMEAWPGVELVDRPRRVVLPGGRVAVFIPYMKDLALLRQTVEDNQEAGALLVMHAGIEGGAVGPELNYFQKDGVLPVETFLEHPWDATKWKADGVISGHYHGHQILHNGNLVYIGAPMQKEFGDRGQQGSVLVLDTDTLKFARIPIDAPTFHYIENVNDTKELRDAVQAIGRPADRMYVRVYLDGQTKLTQAQAVKTLTGRVFHVEVRDRRQTSPQPVAGAAAPRASTSMSDGQLVDAYLSLYPPGPGADADKLRTKALDYLTKARSATP